MRSNVKMQWPVRYIATLTLQRHAWGVIDSPENRATVGGRIARARVQAGWDNRSAFAREVGVDRNTLYKWEAGAMVPDIFNLESVARVTRVSMDWLVRGSVPGAASEVLARWRSSPRGQLASDDAVAFLESLPLAGYIPTEQFYNLALLAFEEGLSVEEAARAAKVTETHRPL